MRRVASAAASVSRKMRRGLQQKHTPRRRQFTPPAGAIQKPYPQHISNS